MVSVLNEATEKVHITIFAAVFFRIVRMDSSDEGGRVMNYRIEKDTLGEVKVPADKLWGAQTQRSKENFPKHVSGPRH